MAKKQNRKVDPAQITGLSVSDPQKVWYWEGYRRAIEDYNDLIRLKGRSEALVIVRSRAESALLASGRESRAAEIGAEVMAAVIYDSVPPEPEAE